MSEGIPRGAPSQTRIALNSVELAPYEWPGDGPPLLFVHANSFHARGWDQVIAVSV